MEADEKYLLRFSPEATKEGFVCFLIGGSERHSPRFYCVSTQSSGLFKLTTFNAPCWILPAKGAVDVHRYYASKGIVPLKARLASLLASLRNRNSRSRREFDLSGLARLKPLELPFSGKKSIVSTAQMLAELGLVEGALYVERRPELFDAVRLAPAVSRAERKLPESLAVVVFVASMFVWQRIAPALRGAVEADTLFFATPFDAGHVASAIAAEYPGRPVVTLDSGVQLAAFCEYLYQGKFDTFTAVHVFGPDIANGCPDPLAAMVVEAGLVALFGNETLPSLVEQLNVGPGVAMVVDDGVGGSSAWRSVIDGRDEVFLRPFVQELTRCLPPHIELLGHRNGFCVAVSALSVFRSAGLSACDFAGSNTHASSFGEMFLQGTIQARGCRVVETSPVRQITTTPWSEDVLAAQWRLIRVPEAVAGRDVCLFVTFAPSSEVAAHSLHYMSELKKMGCFVFCLIVSDSPGLEVDPPPPNVADAVAVRANKGFDFAIWAACLRRHPELWTSRALLLANDSILGPLAPLTDLWKRIQASPADVVGLTASGQIVRHLQSFFLWFKSSALQSTALRTFWNEVRSLSSKDAVIHAYEVRMTRKLEWAGLYCEALFPLAPGIDEASFNPSIQGWRNLLQAKCPFIKVQLLRDNPTGEDLRNWKDDVRAAGYDPALVETMLRARAPDSVVLKPASARYGSELTASRASTSGSIRTMFER
jgi:hypothetical protein